MTMHSLEGNKTSSFKLSTHIAHLDTHFCAGPYSQPLAREPETGTRVGDKQESRREPGATDSDRERESDRDTEAEEMMLSGA